MKILGTNFFKILLFFLGGGAAFDGLAVLAWWTLCRQPLTLVSFSASDAV
jgi:hypothetical protein